MPGARALDARDFARNFALADVRDGLGPYLAVYLPARGRDQAGTGLVLAIAGLVAQGPAGALVDAVAARRAVLALAALTVVAACLLIPVFPDSWPVAALQAGSGMAAAVFAPAIAGIMLGLAGRAASSRRIGRNEAFHAGNAAAAAAAGGLSLWFGPVRRRHGAGDRRVPQQRRRGLGLGAGRLCRGLPGAGRDGRRRRAAVLAGDAGNGARRGPIAGGPARRRCRRTAALPSRRARHPAPRTVTLRRAIPAGANRASSASPAR